MHSAVRFTPEDLELFAEASHDRNPLHLSPDYARVTPFGEPVVYGAAGALACLGAIEVPPGHTVAKLAFEFSRPMFTGIEYRLAAEQSAGRCSVRLTDGSRVLVKATAGFAPGEADAADFAAGPCAARMEAAQLAPADLTEGRSAEGMWAPQAGAFEKLLARFGVAPAFAFPAAALLWSSYLVGMELPGERALFFAVSLSFPGGGRRLPGPLAYRASVRAFNTNGLMRSTVRLEAGQERVADGEVAVMMRPERSAGSNDAIQALLPASASMAEKVAVVTGASRGLGAAISRALTLQGCTVYGNYSRSREDALRLERDLPGFIPVEGDAADPELWRRTAERIAAARGRLDTLICNACPTMTPLTIEPASLDRIHAYIARGLPLVTVPMAALLDALSRSGGTVVLVSSSAVEVNTREWPHYVALKNALEGLVRVAAQQYPRVTFLISRPPKLITDMTASSLNREDAAPPERTAVEIVQALGEAPRPGTVTVLPRSGVWKHSSVSG
jgi:NAD(P)-dependent dehydrogenase (short-subunit alcohol dehydrogenase family)